MIGQAITTTPVHFVVVQRVVPQSGIQMRLGMPVTRNADGYFMHLLRQYSPDNYAKLE